ncbi:MAG: hypothetical protein M1832_002323 [Thelocarpon impressellum]|nr:MAG: hypothetical protein M1832_002323 [Thelocarpon impressellum]
MEEPDRSPMATKKPTPREREGPRNEDGEYFCDHPTCAGKVRVPTFARRCEWSKHMDKHERPYRCEEEGCEKLQGFTYSGGLLRHEREVHKKHGGPRKPLMCPYESCKRSSGGGFTRKENMDEHIRRVHKPVGPAADDASEGSVRKRKRGRSEVGDEAATAGSSPRPSSPVAAADMSSGEAKRLQAEIAEVREELAELRALVARCRADVAKK